MRSMLGTKEVVLECEPDDWPQTLALHSTAAGSILMIPASEGWCEFQLVILVQLVLNRA